MIARIWRGWTAQDQADEYVDYMKATGAAEYVATPGNLDAYMLRRDLGDGRTEFVMVTLWTSMAAVRRFAGDRPERAVFYPEDDRFLVDREVTVDHFEVAWHRPDRPGTGP
jgi:heme-degrading monooxygenase HmoA